MVSCDVECWDTLSKFSEMMIFHIVCEVILKKLHVQTIVVQKKESREDALTILGAFDGPKMERRSSKRRIAS